HVFDARSSSLGTEVLERTGGRGVDVVLNASGAIADSFMALASSGRFVEVGVRDINRDAKQLDHFRENVAYSAVNLRALAVDRAELVGEILREGVQLVEERVFQPLPAEAVGVSEVRKVFDRALRAEHIGKLVCAVDDPGAELHVPEQSLYTSDSGTCLITGG